METSAAHISFDPTTGHLPNMLEPLLSGYWRLAERSRVEDKSVVLVQVFCEDVQVLPCECPNPLANETHLRGIGGL